ncbi:MAG: cytochrome c [Rhodospirillaceae bacterium]|nr:cytochrome c [Rhodospirillaceae bacterium]
MYKFILAALLLLVSSPGLAETPAARGKALYMKVGCYQCHGTVGQGGTAGLRLAPDPLPWQQFAQFVHNTAGIMPPYREQALPAADLKDIYTYLQTIPKPRDLSRYPLLAPFR